MSQSIIPVSNVEYYPFVKKWHKIKPHISNAQVQKALVHGMNKFTMGRCGRPFLTGMKPADVESCDWRLGRAGRHPEYWDYVKHSACHWLVNFNLALAMLVEPERAWRIITSEKHSTVWDGDHTLFDFNFSALQITPSECFALANEDRRHLAPGKRLRVYPTS